MMTGLTQLSTMPLSTTPPARDWRGLIWTIVRTDFKARYHRTVFGFIWALAKPLAMMATLLAVFSLVFAQHADFALNLVVGLFLWDFFAQGTTVGLVSLAQKSFLLSKTRFPSWVLVLTSLSNPLITLLVYSAGTVVVLAVLGKGVSPLMLLLYLLYVTILATIVVGISLALSVLFLRYRDLNQIWEVVTASGFFLTPVVFPLDVIPHRFQFWLHAWPPTPVIQFARSALIQGRAPSLTAHLMLLGVTATILAVGLLVYRRHAPTIAERL
jgi:lipopolysaccharide transport system permease protein